MPVESVKTKEMHGWFNYVDIGSIGSDKKRIIASQKMNWEEASSRARQIIHKGDTLFSTVRVNLERIAFVEEEFDNAIASTGFTVLRGNHEIVSKYLFYAVSRPSFIAKLARLQKGTAYPAVTDKIIFNQLIPLPSIADQKQIVKLFQSIDHAVEQVEEQKAKIEALKKSLLFDLFSKKKQFSEIILQDDYESIRFGSLATNISERVEPKKTDLSIYVGLEHLETDNLVIEKTGSPNDVVGTKLKVSKGDIIFGKRRAYLRKVAVSHFDGIASAHSMVLRANEQNINRAFLPYFMQSDEFMNRAIQISEGSLSPTIKWKTLAAQEFVLPRKDKQPKLVELFKQLDETKELLRCQKNNLIKLKQQLLNEILG